MGTLFDVGQPVLTLWEKMDRQAARNSGEKITPFHVDVIRRMLDYCKPIAVTLRPPMNGMAGLAGCSIDADIDRDAVFIPPNRVGRVHFDGDKE